MTQIFFYTERLILRPFSLEDAEEYYLLTRDEDLEKYVPYSYMENFGDVEDTIYECYSKCDFLNDFYFIVEDKISHKILGFIFITRSHDTTYDVSAFIGKNFRRQGYMSEALNFLLKNLSIRGTLIFTIEADNKPSLMSVAKIDGMSPGYLSYCEIYEKHYLKFFYKKE